MEGRAVRNEKREESRFSGKVQAHGWDSVKLSTQGPYGRRGRNDRLVLAGPPKVVALFEFKDLDGEVEKLQDYMHRKYQKMGFDSYVVYSCNEAWEILESLVAKAKKEEKARLRT